jgi:endothelin-converting enzyme/putative endopeptidase
MRILRVGFLWIAASSVMLCQTSGGSGIQTADINHSVDPCTDFYEFSNGTWRANNPIPPEMQRWSRRWAAGESSKDKLKGILDEVSAQKDLAPGSVRQQIGDFYAACMDDEAVNKVGITPIRPYLDEIDGLKNFTDVQQLIIKFHDQGLFVPPMFPPEDWDFPIATTT